MEVTGKTLRGYVAVGHRLKTTFGLFGLKKEVAKGSTAGCRGEENGEKNGGVDIPERDGCDDEDDDDCEALDEAELRACGDGGTETFIG